jgi:hypothetical protein
VRNVRTAACAFVVAFITLLAPVATAVPASASPSILISSPRPFQVIQRGNDSRASIFVTGLRRGFKGPLEIRWGNGPWSTTYCAGDGSFKSHLAPRRTGQATLAVRGAWRHDVHASAGRIGIGDIYVIAGQSNASGRGSSPSRYTHPVLKAALFGNDYRWKNLADPTDSASGQRDPISKDVYAAGSVWPLLATELMAAEGVPVAFVPCAREGTTIAMWQRDGTAPAWPSTLYGSMLRRVRAVGGRVRAILFWQGEADARDHIAHAVYETLLLRFASDVVADCGARVVTAQIGDYGANWYDAPGVDAIRLAQQDAWTAGTAILPGPVLYDIDLASTAHFTRGSDLMTAARRWAAAILTGVLKRDVARDPRLVEAAYDGDLTITLRFVARPEPLRLGRVDGIVVRADGQLVALSSAMATAPDTVTLLLEAPAKSPLTVTLGSGREAAGAQVPRESSVWELPALMFVEEPVTSFGK